MSEGRQVLVLMRRLLSRPGAVAGDVVGGCEQAALRAARGLAGPDGTVTVCTVGRARREEKALQLALKGYANRAIRVSDSGADRLDYLGVARVLARVTQRADGYQAIVCGDRSADGLSGAVGPALAELLDLPHLSGIVDLEVGDSVVASVRSNGQIHQFRVPLPAVLCIRDCSSDRLPDSAGDPNGSVETLSFRDLELGTKDLAPRTRLEGALSALRGGTNATMVDDARDLVLRLTEDHLL